MRDVNQRHLDPIHLSLVPLVFRTGHRDTELVLHGTCPRGKCALDPCAHIYFLRWPPHTCDFRLCPLSCRHQSTADPPQSTDSSLPHRARTTWIISAANPLSRGPALPLLSPTLHPFSFTRQGARRMPSQCSRSSLAQTRPTDRTTSRRARTTWIISAADPLSRGPALPLLSPMLPTPSLTRQRARRMPSQCSRSSLAQTRPTDLTTSRRARTTWIISAADPLSRGPASPLLSPTLPTLSLTRQRARRMQSQCCRSSLAQTRSGDANISERGTVATRASEHGEAARPERRDAEEQEDGLMGRTYGRRTDLWREGTGIIRSRDWDYAKFHNIVRGTSTPCGWPIAEFSCAGRGSGIVKVLRNLWGYDGAGASACTT